MNTASVQLSSFVFKGSRLRGGNDEKRLFKQPANFGAAVNAGYGGGRSRTVEKTVFADA